MLVESFQPHDIGMPPKFAKGWRPGQYDIVCDALDCTTRFSGHCVPCGFGKTLIFNSIARLLGGRALILTPFKGLQDQVRSEFTFVEDIRGKGSYFCPVTQTNCDLGSPRCSMRSSSIGRCSHKQAMAQARNANVVVTNYSCWYNQQFYSEQDNIGQFDTLILDEADTAEESLLTFLEFHLNGTEVHGDLRYRRSPSWNDGLHHWQDWALEVLPPLRADVKKAEEDAKKSDDQHTLDHCFHLKSLLKKITTLFTLSLENWVCEEDDDGIQFDPIWPGKFAEWNLFRGVKRVLLFSGTLNTKTMALLGIGKDKHQFFEYSSPFHPVRSPFIVAPLGAYTYPISNDLIDKTIKQFDGLMDARYDRKAIFHSVSFKHLEDYIERTKHRGITLANDVKYYGGNRRTSEVVDQFKQAATPTILASPSITAGWDFPDDLCRFSYLFKVPFPDTTSKVEQERKKLDPEYHINKTVIDVVQISARACRSEDDWAETITPDRRINWLFARYGYLAPKWFTGTKGSRRYRSLNEGAMPDPLNI